MTPAAAPSRCIVAGEGLRHATVRQTATFTITAHDQDGKQLEKGGDTFFVAIRGSSRVRAKVIDKSDGTYMVEFKPSVSGRYSISVSAFGESLPGSPASPGTSSTLPGGTTGCARRRMSAYSAGFTAASGLGRTAGAPSFGSQSCT